MHYLPKYHSIRSFRKQTLYNQKNPIDKNLFYQLINFLSKETKELINYLAFYFITFEML